MRFVAGGQQRRIIQLAETQTIIIESSDSFKDGKDVFDLAFTWLPPDIASSLEANGVYLNIEKNRFKMEAMAATPGPRNPACRLMPSTSVGPMLG